MHIKATVEGVADQYDILLITEAYAVIELDCHDSGWQILKVFADKSRAEEYMKFLESEEDEMRELGEKCPTCPWRLGSKEGEGRAPGCFIEIDEGCSNPAVVHWDVAYMIRRVVVEI